MTDMQRDEVSLLDLWKIITEQKRMVFMVWAGCVLLAGIYLVLATPMYQATAYLLPPTQKDVQELNIRVQNSLSSSSGSGSSSSVSLQIRYTPMQAYDLLLQTLKSRANRREFYQTHHIAEKLNTHGSKDDEVFEKGFHEKLQVMRDVKHKENENFVEVSFEGKDADLAAAWVNNFIAQSAIQAKDVLVSDVRAQVASLIKSLQAEIDGKLSVAKQRRLDRIAKLKEALRVAKVVSQEDKQVIQANGLSMMADEVPLYLLGESALRAELDMLSARQDDAPFVEGLRDLQEKLKVLQGIHIDEDKVKTMIWDQKAVVPDAPIKPKKALVMILAMLLGLMLGIMMAFIVHAIKQSKGVEIET